MSRLFLLLLPLLIIFGCQTSRTTTINNDNARALVGEFLEYMLNKSGDDTLKQFISPTSLIALKLKPDDFTVNVYDISGFNVERYQAETEIITANVWGAENQWRHILMFHIVEEDGELYFQPSNYNDGFLNPWIEATEFVDLN